jgi:HEAT repeat protein
MRYLPFPLLGVLAAGCAAVLATSEPGVALNRERADADVSAKLISLLDERKRVRPTIQDLQETALRDIVSLTTPAGYRFKNRYLELGVPLAQSLSLAQDRQLRQRLVEAARWTSSPRTRAEALVALATYQDPDHVKYFREALLDKSVAIQFAALEALQVSGYKEAVPYFLDAAQNSWSPLIRVFAAQAALRLGDARGRDKLLVFLRDNNWLMRAMAARYLGDMGRPEDGDVLLSRIGPEQGNQFVLAEVCIGALKLLAKKTPAPVKPVAPPPSAPAPRARAAFELEPLIITAPRLEVERVDIRIDNELVRLLERLAELPPPEEVIVQDVLTDLNNLITPAGFSLKVRYSDLAFLITEGLAGAKDFGLVQRVESIARTNPDARVRAAALVSLAYNPARRDSFIFQDALRDRSLAVRFGAVEALEIMGGAPVRASLADTAERDDSQALRVYAAQALARSGDAQGLEKLRRYMMDFDWVVRSIAIRALGELGTPDDYYRIQSRLTYEENNFAAAESCLAMLRLAAR